MLDRADVDTDQIIPKQFLKRMERTGFGEFLFYDWAKEPGWDLPANPILATGPNFGCGSSREHAPWALQDYGFQGRGRGELRRHLLQQLHEDRPAAGGAAGGGGARADAGGQRPRSTSRRARCASTAAPVPFELDAETRRRLLEGLDEIAGSPQQGDAIDGLRDTTASGQGPVTTAL